MAEGWKDNLIYKIVALLLAVLLWLYVTADQNPPVEKTLTLSVNYEKLRDDLTLTHKDENVNIKIRGDQKVINNLSVEDFKAHIDLSQVTIGESSFPVNISNNRGVEIIDIYPKEVKVKVDKLSEKQVPVRVALLGQTAHGYSSFKASVKPSHVVIRGPRNKVESMVEARVDVNLNSAKSNLVLNLPAKVLDQRGNLYGSDLFTIIPDTVEVFVPIIEDTPSKTVPVKPVFTGKPASGYQISRILVEPETVKILGNFDKLNKIDKVQTVPISIAETKEDIVREVDLSVPSGVTMLYGTKVKVMVQIEESAVQKDFELPVEIYNSKEEQKIDLQLEKVKVKVEGKKEVIEKLSDKDFKVFVDVSGFDVGIHDLKVQIDAPNDVQVLQINPTKLTVEIKKKEENTQVEQQSNDDTNQE